MLIIVVCQTILFIGYHFFQAQMKSKQLRQWWLTSIHTCQSYVHNGLMCLGVTQGYQQHNHSIECIRLSIQI